MFSWGCSSVGRAPALQAGGHEFESHHLHGQDHLLIMSPARRIRALHIENCILNTNIQAAYESKLQMRFKPIETSNRIESNETNNLIGATLDAVKILSLQMRSNQVKLERAQGGCLGTKSRRRT